MITEERVQNEQSQYKKKMSMLFLSVFIDIAGFGLVLPLLPLFATQLGATKLQFGLLIAVFSAMQFVGAPIWGRLSDRIGRRPVILIGIGGASLSFIMFGLASSLPMLFFARALSGFFTSATLTTAFTYIADITPAEERSGAFGMLGAAFGLGFVVGPAIGGILSQVEFFNSNGYALPAYFAALLALINFVGAYKVLPETLSESVRIRIKETRGKNLVQELRSLPAVKLVALFVILSAFNSLGFSLFVSSAGIYAINVNSSIDEATLGWMYSYTGVIMIVVQGGIVKKLSKKYSDTVFIISGSILSASGLLILAFSSEVWEIYLALTPFMIGMSLLNPSIAGALSKSVPQEKQGTVIGLNQSIASSMRFVGPIMAGLLLEINITFPFFLGALVFLLILGLTLSNVNSPKVDLAYDKKSATPNA
ncbi:MAG: MFS transporter [Candidatus Kariarchaeaceae archaeon]|jgi:multidrug resistance protein